MTESAELILAEYRNTLLSNRPDLVEFVVRTAAGRDIEICGDDDHPIWRGPVKSSGVIFLPDEEKPVFLFRVNWLAESLELGDHILWRLAEKPSDLDEIEQGIIGTDFGLHKTSFTDNGDDTYLLMDNTHSAIILPHNDKLELEDLKSP